MGLNPFLFFRKRGGSVDNLLDDLAEEIGASGHQISAETKKKSVSSKNLSMGPLEEVKITTVWRKQRKNAFCRSLDDIRTHYPPHLIVQVNSLTAVHTYVLATRQRKLELYRLA